MNLLLTPLVIFGYIVAIAQAVDFYITSPWEKIIWKAGDTIQIAWNLLPGGSDITGINLDLMDGNNEKANYISNIAAGLDPNTKFFNWEVPLTVQNSEHYYIRISGIGAQPIYRYSNKFMLWGGEGSSISINSSLLAAQPTIVYIRPTEPAASQFSLPPPVSIVQLNPDGEPIVPTPNTVSAPTSEPVNTETYRGQSSGAGANGLFKLMLMIVAAGAMAGL